MDVFKTLLLDTPDSLNAITGTLQIANGGTGATSAAGARDNLLPDYTGNVGKVLTVNAGATDVEWTGLGTMSTQDAATVNIDGGAIDGTTIGATTPSTVAATTGAFSGSVKVSGPITNAAANSVLFAHNGTDAQVWALGPNPSTQGQLVIVPAQSDASGAAVAATFNASGGNGAWGATTPSTVAATTLTTSGTATFSGNVAVGSNAVTISTGGNVTAIDTVQRDHAEHRRVHDGNRDGSSRHHHWLRVRHRFWHRRRRDCGHSFRKRKRFFWLANQWCKSVGHGHGRHF
jgi:hypothetical protein